MPMTHQSQRGHAGEEGCACVAVDSAVQKSVSLQNHSEPLPGFTYSFEPPTTPTRPVRRAERSSAAVPSTDDSLSNAPACPLWRLCESGGMSCLHCVSSYTRTTAG